MSDLHRLYVREPFTEEIVKQIYRESFFRPNERTCYSKDGKIARWGLDLRKPLSQGERLSAICSIFAEIIKDMNVNQIAGTGYAAAYIIAGAIALNPSLTGGLIRKERKQYGFREIIEGKLQKERPLVLIDDIIASGDTLCELTRVLRQEGFNPLAAIVFFEFAWESGIERLKQQGIKVHAISTLS